MWLRPRISGIQHIHLRFPESRPASSQRFAVPHKESQAVSTYTSLLSLRTAHPGLLQLLHFVEKTCQLCRYSPEDASSQASWWNIIRSTIVSSPAGSSSAHGKQNQCAHFSIQVDNVLSDQSFACETKPNQTTPLKRAHMF